MAPAFYHLPFGTGGGVGFMTSVATGDAMRDSTGDGGGDVFFFCRFEVKAVALASAPELFLEDAPPRVFTIMKISKKEQGNYKRKEKIGLCL